MTQDVTLEPSGPLTGHRIVDLSRLVAGNMLTLLLGDFGADVVKVERPVVGDTLRSWHVGGLDGYWQVYGRNKRSVTLDLRTDLGRSLLLRLLTGADALIESFRPGTLEAFGLAPEQLWEVNPALVVVRITGWGGTGSRAGDPGFGTLVEAASGFAAMNGFADREPCLPPMALSDMTAGLYGAFAVAASLPRARVSGRGELVDLSLFESLFSILGPTAETYLATGSPQPRDGSRTPYSAPRNVYRTGDGHWIAVSAATQATAVRLFQVMDASWLLDDPRFATNQERASNADELDAIVGDYFAGLTLDAALRSLTEAGVTAEAVSSVDDLMDGEYFTSRQVLLTRSGSDGREVRMHNVVPRLTTAPGAVSRRAPRLGEHNDEILRPLATPDEWAELAGKPSQEVTSA